MVCIISAASNRQILAVTFDRRVIEEKFIMGFIQIHEFYSNASYNLDSIKTTR